MIAIEEYRNKYLRSSEESQKLMAAVAVGSRHQNVNFRGSGNYLLLSFLAPILKNYRVTGKFSRNDELPYDFQKRS